ncbi:N-acetylneuraminate synthase family protein [Deltaproteobacteria bacterium]|nr:N-acetylneuraminate synthase family protein [Deltaproteobacteria bacterium]
MAHAYIDAAAEARADAVKFQTHIASEESTLDEHFRVKFALQDDTRFDYWKRMEFSPEQWAGLAQHAKDKGLIFLSSAFSIEAVKLLDKLDIPAWKLGSGEFRSMEMLSEMIKTGKPIIYSTGMSSWQEIDSITKTLATKKYPFVLLQCTSQYPVSSKSVGLNVLDELRSRYLCPVGLSDHTGKVFAPLAAMVLGANMVEVHITFDKRMFGPDVQASLTVDQLALIADARDEFHVMKTHPVDKEQMAEHLKSMRDLFSKSVAPARSLNKGEILTEELLVPRKPGTGIPYTEKNQLVGRQLIKDVMPNRLLRWEDIGKKNA